MKRLADLPLIVKLGFAPLLALLALMGVMGHGLYVMKQESAALERVADRIELHTADMTGLPLDNDSVDVIVSNLAIHNIPTSAGRRHALDEAIRVLRPGGRLAIADLWEVGHHASRLRELGWPGVRRRNLGWRMWYGGPWFATRLVTATKPG